MTGSGRITRGSVALALAGALVLNASTTFAALGECQKRIETEGAKLQKSIYGALKKCKDAVQTERVAGLVSGLGTSCEGGGCMPTAAALCEKQLRLVYDVMNTTPGRSKVDKFRSALEKSRESGECSDADLTLQTGLGHLLSGNSAHSLAPPNTGAACDTNADGHADPNCAGKFMIDWHLFAIEKVVIEQQLLQVPEMLNLLREAVEAGPGPVNGSGVAAKKGTSCSNVSLNPNTQEFRPNLCRFGVECRDHACTINSAGMCASSAQPCDTVTQVPCDPGDACVPTASSVSLQSSFGIGPLAVGLGGRLVTAICRPGRISGTCQSGGAPCLSDADCGGNCNLFPGLGAGAAFGAEADFLYLINEPSRTLQAPSPLPPPLNMFLDAVCLEVQRSQGWCDCDNGGSAANVNVTACQDHITSDNTGTDDCLAAINAQNSDSIYPGTVNGTLTVSTGGSSVAGDCVELLTLSAKIIPQVSDRGPDGLACTEDDFTAPLAPLTVPVTTGTASGIIKDAVDQPGTCSGGTNNGDSCIEAANCPGGTCTGAVIHAGSFGQGTKTGAKTNCTNYLAGNLSGLALVGSAPLLNVYPPVGDLTMDIRLECQ